MSIQRISGKVARRNPIVAKESAVRAQRIGAKINRGNPIVAKESAVVFTQGFLLTQSGDRLITESSENILLFDPAPYSAGVKRQNVITATVKHTLTL